MIKLKNNKKGFSLIELIVVIAIMVVMLMVLVPSLLRYVEKSRMQRDDSAMSEVVHCTKIAINKTEVYDECFDYAASGNFTGYIDSDGKVTGKRDEERWAPSGSGKTLTITFNPDENGFYSMEKARVNDMGQQKTQQTRQKARGRISTNTGEIKKCNFEDMGNKYLYNSLKTSIGEQLKSVSATYRHSSYTLFIVFNDGNVSTYGEWNGTNLSDEKKEETDSLSSWSVTHYSESQEIGNHVFLIVQNAEGTEIGRRDITAQIRPADVKDVTNDDVLNPPLAGYMVYYNDGRTSFSQTLPEGSYYIQNGEYIYSDGEINRCVPMFNAPFYNAKFTPSDYQGVVESIAGSALALNTEGMRIYSVSTNNCYIYAQLNK